MEELTVAREAIRNAHLANESAILQQMIARSAPDATSRQRISARAERLIRAIRGSDKHGLMEIFLAEYGLSSNEGVALMCLAEALLRVPDAKTIDDLIEDKIAPSQWSAHLGRSASPLVNTSTWALLLTGKVLADDQTHGLAAILHGALKRLGEPVIRAAVKRAMKEMGHQFVLGRTIDEAIKRAAPLQNQGFDFSYDMLGEAALTEKDAANYFAAYQATIKTLSETGESGGDSGDIYGNPGISVKLSALHPRYEMSQKQRVMEQLVASVKSLAMQAKAGQIGFNIDAEEADRLDLSLDVIKAVLSAPELAGWHGFGVVVQTYSKRASFVIDWLYALAKKHKRKIMVRLVKGAYWDSEIKRAQIEGLADFPVFTRKKATDMAYICCAKQLLEMGEYIYPQFATHNAHSVAAILEMAPDKQAFEFQALYGMGEALHTMVLAAEHTRCRIYAPVGAHKDLLAYLVRRLLENGANSSVVNQIMDKSVAAATIAADPFVDPAAEYQKDNPLIKNPRELFAPERKNSKGWDLHDVNDIAQIKTARKKFIGKQWHAKPIIYAPLDPGAPLKIINPANPNDCVGFVHYASPDVVETALKAAQDWSGCPAAKRAGILDDAADLFEANFAEFFALLAREAGKTTQDAISELREAVDFLRYYGAQARQMPAPERFQDKWTRLSASKTLPNKDLSEGFVETKTEKALKKPCGLFATISPWNFPLAIFTGQIGAALAAGNGVLAKPAETTPLVASVAVNLLHRAGVPRDVLQFLPGAGPDVGAKLTSDKRINGVCFTGSIATAQTINRAMAAGVAPGTPLIAETGGINAMIVDSTALPEQAVRDILVSAFQSAGQRCSALRVLYLQEDIAEPFLEMLIGALDQRTIGDPLDLSSDIGPTISAEAQSQIAAYIENARRQNRLLKQMPAPKQGHFVGPAIIKIDSIAELKSEIFGPVLHVATFSYDQIKTVISEINASGFGLTFGLHTRIDTKVDQITAALDVGNIYVNRNQIGAVVGSQPFGGEALSGTGPKAGGPNYLRRFYMSSQVEHAVENAPPLSFTDVQSALDLLKPPARAALKTLSMPGPTGETNMLSLYPRGVVLCLGPSKKDAGKQMAIARKAGCVVLGVAPGLAGPDTISGNCDPQHLEKLNGFDAVMSWSTKSEKRRISTALAARSGPIVQLIAGDKAEGRFFIERHICIDTTATGGNASLLSAGS